MGRAAIAAAKAALEGIAYAMGVLFLPTLKVGCWVVLWAWAWRAARLAWAEEATASLVRALADQLPELLANATAVPRAGAQVRGGDAVWGTWPSRGRTPALEWGRPEAAAAGHDRFWAEAWHSLADTLANSAVRAGWHLATELVTHRGLR